MRTVSSSVTAQRKQIDTRIYIRCLLKLFIRIMDCGLRVFLIGSRIEDFQLGGSKIEDLQIVGSRIKNFQLVSSRINDVEE